MHQPRCTASKELRGCFHVDGEGVCVCYCLRSRFPCMRVCLCLGRERKKDTRCVWWREAVDGEKEDMCYGFKKVFISKMRTIMCTYFSLAVNVCGWIPICNSIQSARWGLERPKSYTENKSPGWYTLKNRFFIGINDSMKNLLHPWNPLLETFFRFFWMLFTLGKKLTFIFKVFCSIHSCQVIFPTISTCTK